MKKLITLNIGPLTRISIISIFKLVKPRSITVNNIYIYVVLKNGSYNSGWRETALTSTLTWTCCQALTSSWSDGSRGPIGFCLPEGSVPIDFVKSWNQSHIGESMVVLSQSSTHFMNSDTMIQILEQLVSPALEKQRARYLGSNLVHFSNLLNCERNHTIILTILQLISK